MYPVSASAAEGATSGGWMLSGVLAVLLAAALAAVIHLRRSRAAVPSGEPAAPAEGVTANGDSAESVESRAIQLQLERLAAFAGAAGIGMYTVDAEGRFLSANETFAAFLGTGPDALISGDRRLHDFVAGNGDASFPPHRPLSGEDGRAEGEVALVNGDGRQFRAFVSSVDHDDGTLRAHGLVREAAAQTPDQPSDCLQALAADLFFKAPLGIAFVDLVGRIEEANAAFAWHTEGHEDLLRGKFLKGLVAVDSHDSFMSWFGEAVRGAAEAKSVRVHLKGSAGRAVELSAARTDGKDGGPRGVLVYMREADDQAELGANVAQSQKMELVGQLAGGVAHDFNNLLTAMIGFCDLLLLRHSPKDHSFADIMQIKQNANRAANLVRQLLAFSRQQTLQPRVLNLTDVLAELSHLLTRLIGATVELNMVHERDLGLVKVDQGQFEQVVINLAVNARDAMADGGTLTIRTMNVPAGDPRIAAHSELPDTDHVVIEVSDTGCGVPKDLIDKIFEPFFTTKEVGSGTGLGLSTVYGIIKQTGGHVDVASAEGEGTTFTIFLPRHRAEEEAAEARADRAEAERRRDSTGTGTVLLVEDEDAVRLFGARALRNKGYDVLEAVNGENALEVMEANERPIDLLITDVVMPGLDGPGLIRRVRENHPELKVIFISGYTEDAFRKRLDSGDQAHFLPKPFSLQQLAVKVKEVMLGETC